MRLLLRVAPNRKSPRANVPDVGTGPGAQPSLSIPHGLTSRGFGRWDERGPAFAVRIAYAVPPLRRVPRPARLPRKAEAGPRTCPPRAPMRRPAGALERGREAVHERMPWDAAPRPSQVCSVHACMTMARMRASAARTRAAVRCWAAGCGRKSRLSRFAPPSGRSATHVDRPCRGPGAVGATPRRSRHAPEAVNRR
jgi:hypothetical protein